jgi:hypothetical protein
VIRGIVDATLAGLPDEFDALYSPTMSLKLSGEGRVGGELERPPVMRREAEARSSG